MLANVFVVSPSRCAFQSWSSCSASAFVLVCSSSKEGLGTVVPLQLCLGFRGQLSQIRQRFDDWRPLHKPYIAVVHRPPATGRYGALNGRCGEQRLIRPLGGGCSGALSFSSGNDAAKRLQASILFVAGRTSTGSFPLCLPTAHRAVTMRCHPLLPHGCCARTVATLSPLLGRQGPGPIRLPRILAAVARHRARRLESVHAPRVRAR